MNAHTSMPVLRISVILVFAIFVLFVLVGNQGQAHADLYPFDDPPTGDEVLCHINGLEEVNGTPIIHPPVPGFDVGECGDEGGEEPEPTAPACSNNQDDDGDGFTDEDDPNCHTDGDPTNASSYNPNKISEAGSLPACWNGVDDDADGKTDFPSDPGCSSATDTDESDNGDGGEDDNGGGGSSLPQCSNGSDDDGDELIDSEDPGCHTDFDAGNANSYDPQGNDESASVHVPQCSDGIDNDSDGVIDLVDGGCGNADDDDESNNNFSGGGGGGGGSSRSAAPAVLGAATTTPLYTIEEIAACDTYLTAFIKLGNNNDQAQVVRLQRFLNDFEGASLEVNGLYGTSTLAAVHSFQTKYAADILTPWGIGESTGFVYLTTRKKVNEIFCNYTKSFPLTEEQQRFVDEARARVRQQTSPEVASPSAPRAPEVPTSPSSSGSQNSQPGPFNGVFNFLQGLFGGRGE